MISGKHVLPYRIIKDNICNLHYGIFALRIFLLVVEVFLLTRHLVRQQAHTRWHSQLQRRPLL